jgi:hypothetical protein
MHPAAYRVKYNFSTNRDGFPAFQTQLVLTKPIYVSCVNK